MTKEPSVELTRGKGYESLSESSLNHLIIIIIIIIIIRNKRGQCSESAGRILEHTTGYTLPYCMENLT